MSAYIASLWNDKGGVGKTTVAVNMATVAAATGLKVALVDADPQRSARDWQTLAGEEGFGFPVIGLDTLQQLKGLKEISQPYDLVIVDGAPRAPECAATVLKQSDLFLIPVQPSALDLLATQHLASTVVERLELIEGTDTKLEARFLITMAGKNTVLGREISNAAQELGVPVMKSRTHRYEEVKKLVGRGETVVDLGDDHPSKQEIAGIINEAFAILNGEKEQKSA
ncbi:AAA family ATPase (plasmid) [Neptuniibacter sp. QD72_48]|uniref:AAA family ATPase n=1 Tax=Neptuniibacter sp. QD72_48 TaxID=3398214 RepID=UPI0039F4B0B8